MSHPRIRPLWPGIPAPIPYCHATASLRAIGPLFDKLRCRCPIYSVGANQACPERSGAESNGSVRPRSIRRHPTPPAIAHSLPTRRTGFAAPNPMPSPARHPPSMRRGRPVCLPWPLHPTPPAHQETGREDDRSSRPVRVAGDAVATSLPHVYVTTMTPVIDEWSVQT